MVACIRILPVSKVDQFYLIGLIYKLANRKTWYAQRQVIIVSPVCVEQLEGKAGIRKHILSEVRH